MIRLMMDNQSRLVRGADIIKLNDVPTRHITSKHSDRLLEDGAL